MTTDLANGDLLAKFQHVQHIDKQREQYAKLCMGAAIHWEGGRRWRAMFVATRLWNYADNQRDADFLFSLLAIACPWFNNKICFTYLPAPTDLTLRGWMKYAKLIGAGWEYAGQIYGKQTFHRITHTSEFCEIDRDGNVSVF